MLRAGIPGVEIAALVLDRPWPRVSHCGTQAGRSRTSGYDRAYDTHPGAADAYLALAGTLIDRNEFADAIVAFGRLDEVPQANPFARVNQVLVELEKVRVAAALDDFDDVFGTVLEAGILIGDIPRSGLRCLVDAVAPAGT